MGFGQPLSSQGAGLEGVADLTAKLKALGSEFVGPTMRAVLRAAIKPAFEKANQTIPIGLEAHRTYKGRLVAPGFSKRSIRIVTRLDKNGTTASVALGVRKEAFYAVLFEELGTSKMAARPWLRPSLQSTQEQQQTILASKLRERIERIAKK